MPQYDDTDGQPLAADLPAHEATHHETTCATPYQHRRLQLLLGQSTSLEALQKGKLPLAPPTPLESRQTPRRAPPRRPPPLPPKTLSPHLRSNSLVPQMQVLPTPREAKGEAKRIVRDTNADEYRRALSRFAEVERKYKAEEMAAAMRQKQRKLYKQRAETFSARLRVARRATQVAFKERALARLYREHVVDLAIEPEHQLKRDLQTTNQLQRQNSPSTSTQPFTASSVGLKSAPKEPRFQVILRGELQEADEQHRWRPVACELFTTLAKQCGAPVAILRYYRPHERGRVSSGAVALFSTGRIQIEGCVFDVWPRADAVHKRFRAPDTDTRDRWTGALLGALDAVLTTPQTNTARFKESNIASLAHGEERTASFAVAQSQTNDAHCDIHRASCLQPPRKQSGDLNETRFQHQARPSARRDAKFSGTTSEYDAVCGPYEDSIHMSSTARKISTRVFPQRDDDEGSYGPHDYQSSQEDLGFFLSGDQCIENSPASRLTFESVGSPVERTNSLRDEVVKDIWILPDDCMPHRKQNRCGFAMPSENSVVEESLALHAHVNYDADLRRNESPLEEPAPRRQEVSRHFMSRYSHSATGWCLKTARSIAGVFLLADKS